MGLKRRKKGKRILGRGKEARLRPYYTIVVGTGPTQWHATERTGPWSKITRGAFDTASEARAWARENLGLHGNWKIKRITESQSGPYLLRTLRSNKLR